MLKFLTGDILKSKADCLVNTVNCEGFMGKGIAYQFKLAFPENNDSYIKACKLGNLTVGKLHFHRENGKLIVNFPTKNKWREKSDISYIIDGLKELKKLFYEQRIGSVAIPPLGCGNGGLNWVNVKNVILDELDDCKDDLDIYIYEPSKTLNAELKEPPKLTASHLVIMRFKPLLKRFNKANVQRCAFFMCALSGEDIFSFKRDKQGPYSNLIENIMQNINEYQAFYKLSTNKAYELAQKTLVSKKVKEKINYLSPFIIESTKIINKINQARELELTASICQIIKEKSNIGINEILIEINKWSDENTNILGIVDVENSMNFLIDNNVIQRDLLNNYSLYKR